MIVVRKINLNKVYVSISTINDIFVSYHVFDNNLILYLNMFDIFMPFFLKPDCARGCQDVQIVDAEEIRTSMSGE